MRKFLAKSAAIVSGLLLCTQPITAQNPFLPLWEYIPDGEPYVFEDPDCPGKYRVYIYGSHDTDVTAYCGREQVTWSASVDDLTHWRYDGVIFRCTHDSTGNPLNEGRGDMLYAPDVCETVGADGKKTYYLYPNNQERGREGMIAKSNRPDGPFEVCNWDEANPKAAKGVLRFDPAVLVDDDGRVYGYWGFQQSFAAELDPQTMCTVKPGTKIVENMVPSYTQDDTFRFFEASSIRKIEDKYVFIYSRWSRNGEWGLHDSNYTLAYAYSDNPLGPFTYGGTIIDARARVTTASGKVTPTATPYGNTHGSIFQANGQWWVVYHRQNGINEFSRQAMAAPLTVKVEKGKGGKVLISEAEYTSEGFATEGLDPFRRTPAALACYYTGPNGVGRGYPNFYFSGSFISPNRLAAGNEQTVKSLFETGTGIGKHVYNTVVNNTSGSVVGFKYFNFPKSVRKSNIELHMRLIPAGVAGTLTVWVGGISEAEGGIAIATLNLKADAPQELTEFALPVHQLNKLMGKQPLYFRFQSATPDKSLCELHDFMFVKRQF